MSGTDESPRAITPEQLREMAKRLDEDGFVVVYEFDEWNDGGNGFVRWGEWAIDQDGYLNTWTDGFPVNHCGIAAFIAAVHKHWHAVGGSTRTDDWEG